LEGLGTENVGIFYGHREYVMYSHLVYFMGIHTQVQNIIPGKEADLIYNPSAIANLSLPEIIKLSKT
jgi:hypothetical protein